MKFRVTLSISVAIHALLIAWIIFIVPSQKEDSPIEITLGMYNLKKPGEVMKGHPLPSKPMAKKVAKTVHTEKPIEATVPVEAQVQAQASTGTGNTPGPTSQDVGEGGGGGGVDTPLSRYVQKIRKLIAKNHHYPKRAIYLGQHGTVRLQITIDQTGKIKKLKVDKAPPYPILVDASKEMVKKIGTFPPMPKDVLLQELSMTVPINYNIEE